MNNKSFTTKQPVSSQTSRPEVIHPFPTKSELMQLRNNKEIKIIYNKIIHEIGVEQICIRVTNCLLEMDTINIETVSYYANGYKNGKSDFDDIKYIRQTVLTKINEQPVEYRQLLQQLAKINNFTIPIYTTSDYEEAAAKLKAAGYTVASSQHRNKKEIIIGI